jgi:hypothetical protein
VDSKHNGQRLAFVFCEKLHQDEDDEVHWGEVVIEHNHAVQGGQSRFCAAVEEHTAFIARICILGRSWGA